MSNAKGTALLKDILKFATQGKAFDRVLENIKIISGGGGNCVAEFTVQEEHLNKRGTLHGGFSATLVDSISTYALMTHEKGEPGVSVDIHMTYLKAATKGEEVVVDAKTVKTGRTLAFLDVELKKKKSGEIIAKGSHTKFVG